MKRKLIPDPPKPEEITEEVEKNRNTWIEYFKNMSQRIKIITPQDKDFNLKIFEDSCKRGLGYSNDVNHMRIVGWPDKDQIAFILYYDSKFTRDKPEYLTANAVIFCFGDYAFDLGCNTFEQVGQNDGVMEYEIVDYDNKEWKFHAKLIRERLIEIQESIPQVPPY